MTSTKTSRKIATSPLVRGGGFGFSVFRLGWCGPAAEIESDGHAGVAEFVGEGRIDEGASDDHAADTQRRDALRGGAARAAVPGQAALEDADHGTEDGLEGAPGGFAAAGDIGGQGHHGAGVLDIFKMLAGEIGADDLRPNVAGREVHFYAFPTTFPVWVGEEAGEDLGVEIALAMEIAVEAAVREAGAGHDLLDGDALKAMPIKQFACAFNDGLLDGRAMTRWVRHAGSFGREVLKYAPKRITFSSKRLS